MLGHMRQCLVPLLVVLAGAPGHSAAEHAHVFPGTGVFEPEVRASVAAVHAARLGGGGGGGVGAPLDIRVAKARGDRGYNAVRLSVVGHAAMGLGATITGSRAGEPVPFSHDAPFVHRWFASFDLGTPAKSCSPSSRYNTSVVDYDADCMLACSHDDGCGFYTWHPAARRCVLSTPACTLTPDPTAETYAKYGRNWLASAVVELGPGINRLEVAGEPVEVSLPAQGSGVRALIVSDPCFSGRWVGCQYGVSWDTFNRTALMLNALASKGDVDMFAILGDNLYDQDGRLTTALFRALSPEFKRTPLLTTPGNHDIWVAGGPGPTADKYDQYGHGFMQWYAQDALAASTGPSGGDGTLFNVSVVPGDPVNNELLNNDPDNFLLYHQLGNLGIIAYVAGGVNESDLTQGLEEACAFMASPGANGTTDLLVLGHWNDASSGCPVGSETPSIRDTMAKYPGCARFGDRLRFADGHTHCNHAQGEEGFMIGGHGMSGCGQYGFMLVDSTDPAGLSVKYFEERSEAKDSFEPILECIQSKGVAGCTHLAATWL